jgi:hypothetical protein
MTAQTVRATVTHAGPGGSMRRNGWGVTLADGTILWARLRGRGPRTTEIPTLQRGQKVVVEWLPGTELCRIAFSNAIEWISPSKLERMIVRNCLQQLAALVDSPHEPSRPLRLCLG